MFPSCESLASCGVRARYLKGSWRRHIFGRAGKGERKCGVCPAGGVLAPCVAGPAVVAFVALGEGDALALEEAEPVRLGEVFLGCVDVLQGSRYCVAI